MNTAKLGAVAVIALFAAPPIAAQTGDARSAAESALVECIAAQSDPSRFRSLLHYPQFGYFDEFGLIVIDSPDQFDPEPELAERSKTKDECQVVAAPVISPDQVHLIARIDAPSVQGRPAAKLNEYFVVTKQGDRWGVQFASPLPDTDPNQESIEAAKRVIADFFSAWNAADNEAIHGQINFPHVFLVREGRASIAYTPEELVTDFQGMRERDGWARSEYHGFEVIYADEAKVIARLTFTRLHADGTIYRTVPVVWIITNRGGHWGLQLRMILPALEAE